ncbi:hypothetical protein FCN77_05855 [Arthrobacter sp. 24S4-2]|uniref:hypothetical protein n=1 Tax=Arthrobacter sp. 24S4-2 TaxID=2575374 RepID=UPI0010C7CAAA|nr:hypothetical protein [Arthrobacter sp. 24S4-2]QCO97329.1 hypothetical protein FCN77_05855 [Arthrobacter sp. 24S4-2]
MKSAVPAESSLEKVVDLDMSNGTFPSSGAILTFTVDRPVPADKVPFIARWDGQNLTWVPLASDTSPDRTTVSAKLEHFSTYGLLDFLGNGIGKLVGARTTPPECTADPPAWDDKTAPQFYDDINGPVLWCATTDPEHPDDLEIKLKLNRGAAASITTAIKPVWAQSDLWQGDTPETWATMVLSGPDALIPNLDTYFIQPTGEFAFRFNKSDLLNFWHSNRTKSLIEVDATVPYVLAGLLYNQISDSSVVPALSLVTTLMALIQCSSEISGGVDLVLSSSSLKSVASELPGMMARLAPCLSGKSKSIAQAAAKFWATRDPASTITEIEKRAATASKSILAVAQIYAAVQVLAPVADALTDLLLDPIARQFVFQPSDQALKAFLGPAPIVPTPPGDLYTGTFHTGYLFQPGPPTLSPLRASLSVRYPHGWTPSLMRFGRPANDTLTFLNSQGKEEVTFDFRSDREGAAGSSPYQSLENTPVTIPGIPGMGPGYHTAFIARLYSRGPGWGLPPGINYAVDLFLSDAEPVSPPVQGEESGGILLGATNGVIVQLSSEHGFATEQEARDYVKSQEYQLIKSLLTSVSIKTWSE